MLRTDLTVPAGADAGLAGLRFRDAAWYSTTAPTGSAAGHWYWSARRPGPVSRLGARGPASEIDIAVPTRSGQGNTR